jgi:hypothetical protein
MSRSVSETVDEVASWSLSRKAEYCDILLSELTVVNREIWSNENWTDAEKIDALKWSNEFAHRVWNLKWRLNHGEDNFINSMNGYMDDYSKEQPKLATLLPWALDSAKRRLLRSIEAE